MAGPQTATFDLQNAWLAFPNQAYCFCPQAHHNGRESTPEPAASRAARFGVTRLWLSWGGQRLRCFVRVAPFQREFLHLCRTVISVGAEIEKMLGVEQTAIAGEHEVMRDAENLAVGVSGSSHPDAHATRNSTASLVFQYLCGFRPGREQGCPLAARSSR